jgi:hypothetical protein
LEKGKPPAYSRDTPTKQKDHHPANQNQDGKDNGDDSLVHALDDSVPHCAIASF